MDNQQLGQTGGGVGGGATRRINKAHRQNAVVKRTVKYLSVCTDPRAYSAVLQSAPDKVIKIISDAAYNVERGPMYLTPAQKALFRTHRKSIATLSSRRVGIKSKRKTMASQRGGFPFLPILIGSALGALGSRLFGGTSSNQQQQ